MSSFTRESERTGRWVPQGIGDASYAAFIPAPLPSIPPDTNFALRLSKVYRTEASQK
jgi:hypothetical protein